MTDKTNASQGDAPELPAPVGCIEYPGDKWTAPWVSTADAYDEDQMRSYAESVAAPLRAQLDKCLRVLVRIEAAVDWSLGRSAFTQSTNLKGIGHSQQVRKELYAAHDEVRAAIQKMRDGK